MQTNSLLLLETMLCQNISKCSFILILTASRNYVNKLFLMIRRRIISATCQIKRGSYLLFASKCNNRIMALKSSNNF